MTKAAWIGAIIGAAASLPGCVASRPATPAPGVGEARPMTPGDAVLGVEAWTFEGVKGRAITTRSFRIYTTSPDSATIARLPAFLDAALTHYRSALTPLPMPPAPMETYMMPSRPQWERLTRRLLGDRAGPYLRIVRGGFAAGGRAVYYDIGPRDSLLIAAHEGWHQYAQTTFKGSMPVWLDEGVATYMEGFRWDPDQPDRAVFLPWSNPERFDRLRAAASAGRLLPLAELLATTPQAQIRRGSDEILAYYAQLWALIHFLNEGELGAHRAVLVGMLRDAAGGADVRSLDTSIAELDDAYRRFVRDITRPGARNAVIAGRSPVSR